MWFNDTPLATGTAFFYECNSRTFLVTNRHNLTGRHQDTGKPLDEKNLGIPNRIRFKVPVAEQQGNFMVFAQNQVATMELTWPDEDSYPWLEHPTWKSKADVVALDVQKYWPELPKPFAHANIIPHATPLSLHPALKVSVIGYPFGQSVGDYYPVWVSGTLASDPSFDVAGKPAMFVDCRTNKGSSGSPVFAYVAGGLAQVEHGKLNTDKNGVFMQYNHTDGTHWCMFGVPAQRFLGIYSGRINSGADIGFVWRAEVIEEVCRSAFVK